MARADIDLDRGRRLREAREAAGLSRLRLATAAGIDSVTTIENLEKGKSGGHPGTWRGIEAVLGPIPPSTAEAIG
jgi:transcriptional regulator with XRE-family HTH domain